MQNLDTVSRVHFKPATRNIGPVKNGAGGKSHQLRLEINRRQMRRVPTGLSRRVSDFSHPSHLPRTIRLFSANTKRYTSPTTLLHSTLSHPSRIPGGVPLLSFPKYASKIEVYLRENGFLVVSTCKYFIGHTSERCAYNFKNIVNWEVHFIFCWMLVN